MSISEDTKRQGKCSGSCTRLVNPILVPTVATDDQPGPVVFLAGTKKFDIAPQTLREPPTMQNTVVNSNHDNNNTEKSLEASLRLSIHCKYNILNNQHHVLKI